MCMTECLPDVFSDLIEEALREAWRGAPEKFDALLGDGEEDSVGVCAVLLEVRGMRRAGAIEKRAKLFSVSNGIFPR
jgi:hypothetical protein